MDRSWLSDDVPKAEGDYIIQQQVSYSHGLYRSFLDTFTVVQAERKML